MSEIKIFESEQFGKVRITMSENDEPMFCLTDVCCALGIINVSGCRSRLRENGVALNDTLTNGGIQKMIYIDESNLYQCIFSSNKNEAILFRDWVCDDVLPEIRKTGYFNIIKKLDEIIYIGNIEVPNVYTYLIKDITGLTKIGRSVDVHERMKQLSTGNTTLLLVHIIDADVERLLHKRYDAKRVSGEWFNLTEKDIEEIKNKYN